jgi:hypothetical protein
MNGAPRAFHQKLACRREPDATRGPVKETVPDDFFQPFDLLAQRWLGHAKSLCGFAEMKGLGHRQKVPQMAKLQFVIHMPIVSISILQILDI